MPQLRFVVVIPAGGGKTTNATDDFYVDIDAFYHLNENQDTYDRINQELVQQAQSKTSIPDEVGEELRRRIAKYDGPAACLLVHTVAVAQQTKLRLLAVLMPGNDLHEASIMGRQETGRWFAKTNRAVVQQESADLAIEIRYYADWPQLSQALKAIQQRCVAMSVEQETIVQGRSQSTNQSEDEKHLIRLLASAVGCAFDQDA